MARAKEREEKSNGQYILTNERRIVSENGVTVKLTTFACFAERLGISG